jgi:hypothetical protein
LLTILLGRILHIEEAEEMGSEVEREVQTIIQAISPTFTQGMEELVGEAALDILRYLPLRTANEISYVLDFVGKAEDEQVQAAVAQALKYAKPKTEEAKQALSVGKNSPVEAVRKAVEIRLANLKM